MKLTDLETYLDRQGWPHQRLSDVSLRTHWQGPHRVVPICIRIDPEGYLALVVISGLSAPEDKVVCGALLRRLMELNHQMMMAKFAIDDDLDVILAAEYPLPNLDETEIRDAIEHIAYYADHHWNELRAVVAQATAPC